jgi:hypothetical protein
VYIDDLILFGTDQRAVNNALDQYISACDRRGLTVKHSKVVRASLGAVVECLGIEVNGRTHEVGMAAAKLRVLCQQTMAFIRRSSCTGLELARLVGKWTWACLPRRPSLAVFSSVYRFVETAKGGSMRLWHSAKRELAVVSALAPLLFSRMSAVWLPRVVATDASSTGLGVVATPLSSSRVAMVAAEPVSIVGTDAVIVGEAPVTTNNRCRFQLMSGQFPSQSPPYLSSAGSVGDTCSAGDGCMPLPLCDNVWSTIVAARWRAPEHINVLELRAIMTALHWTIKSPTCIGRRLLLLSDSTVATYAVAKGRSSSPLLLRRLRSLSSLLLSSGIQLCIRWIRSEVNPADEPSRRLSW